MAEVFLRRLTRWQADQQRETVADTYVKTYGGDPSGRPEFLRRFADHIQQPGFEMVVANGGGDAAGCAYGFPPRAASGWWTGLHGELPVDVAESAAAGKVFVIVDLMVVPQHRRQGLAGRMRERLLAGTDAGFAAVRVPRDNYAALAAFRSWDWSMLGEWRPDPQTPPADVWGCRLRP
ncbi:MULTISPECIES: GNAT family N-acetyltransferase [unclassified Embleya]|uniref:GNAT family N-acetyltransferase n=1 Tax=unclassified Embleya TaxID=2699296 RepID=UPI0036B5F1C9